MVKVAKQYFFKSIIVPSNDFYGSHLHIYETRGYNATRRMASCLTASKISHRRVNFAM